MKVSTELKFEISLKEAGIEVQILDVSCKDLVNRRNELIFSCLVTNIQYKIRIKIPN
jgi:hypothetical protein